MPRFIDLTSGGRDGMMQLFVTGPTWDGNVISKSGRDELVSHQLAEHRNGWAYLTRAGVELAISDQTKEVVQHWQDRRFYHKIVAM